MQQVDAINKRGKDKKRNTIDPDINRFSMMDMLRNDGNNVSARELTIKPLKYDLKISRVCVSGNKRTVIDILINKMNYI